MDMRQRYRQTVKSTFQIPRPDIVHNRPHIIGHANTALGRHEHTTDVGAARRTSHRTHEASRVAVLFFLGGLNMAPK
jgi:hypothetical protein